MEKLARWPTTHVDNTMLEVRSWKMDGPHMCPCKVSHQGVRENVYFDLKAWLILGNNIILGVHEVVLYQSMDHNLMHKHLNNIIPVYNP